jgi:hypothetical protein
MRVPPLLNPPSPLPIGARSAHSFIRLARFRGFLGVSAHLAKRGCFRGFLPDMVALYVAIPGKFRSFTPHLGVPSQPRTRAFVSGSFSFCDNRPPLAEG